MAITGDGSFNNAYVVYTAEDFDAIRNTPYNVGGNYIVLSNDIDLRDLGVDWVPITHFVANLSGGGANFKITYELSSSSVGFGLFQKIGYEYQRLIDFKIEAHVTHYLDYGGGILTQTFDGNSLGMTITNITFTGSIYVPSISTSVNISAIGTYINYTGSLTISNCKNYIDLPVCAAGTAGMIVTLSFSNSSYNYLTLLQNINYGNFKHYGSYGFSHIAGILYSFSDTGAAVTCTENINYGNFIQEYDSPAINICGIVSLGSGSTSKNLTIIVTNNINYGDIGVIEYTSSDIKEYSGIIGQAQNMAIIKNNINFGTIYAYNKAAGIIYTTSTLDNNNCKNNVAIGNIGTTQGSPNSEFAAIARSSNGAGSDSIYNSKFNGGAYPMGSILYNGVYTSSALKLKSEYEALNFDFDNTGIWWITEEDGHEYPILSHSMKTTPTFTYEVIP